MPKEVIPNHLVNATRGGRALTTVSFALVTASVIGYTIAPEGVGGVAFVSFWLILILAVIVGPLARGARPRRIWTAQSLAGVFLLLSLVAQLTSVTIGGLRGLDITYLFAYAFFLLWLILLTVTVGGRRSRTSILDSAAAGVGVSLALWAVTLAPLLSGQRPPLHLVYVLHPVLDVVLLALAAHLAWRLEVPVPSVQWLIAAITIQLFVDTTHAVIRLLSPDTTAEPVFPLFLYWLFCLAMAATHRSVVSITRLGPGRRPNATPSAIAAVMVLAASPAILSTAIPVTGTLDLCVRTALVALLLALLIVRLKGTMAALHQAEADSRHRATHDEMTGLLNRAALIESLDRLLAINDMEHRRTAMLFFDCDNFKHVNDTWGHHAGDTLLADIAGKLPEAVGQHDVFARHGGDEFVICATVADAKEAEALAERIERFFDAPLRILPGRVHAVTSSMGVALAEPADGSTSEELIGRADIAMYEAKVHARGRYVVFGEELQERSRTRADVGDRL